MEQLRQIPHDLILIKSGDKLVFIDKLIHKNSSRSIAHTAILYVFYKGTGLGEALKKETLFSEI
ncbi:MAG TPA: hypothetical protein DIW64_01755 [Cellvibrio sp.]|nr:hypothetical protein [Cellvibrio sp.]